MRGEAGAPARTTVNENRAVKVSPANGRPTKGRPTKGRPAKGRDAFPVLRAAGFKITFPDLITALNLVAGVAAVFSAITGEIVAAIILVGGGMLFDYFDGKIARAYHLSHDFGRELDSLADLVTFGVAPGVILLSLFPGSNLILVAAALYAVVAAFRLARFNLLKEEGKAEKEYAGLPVPAAAFLLLGTTFLRYAFALPVALYCVVALLCCFLMLSTLRFPKL